MEKQPGSLEGMVGIAGNREQGTCTERTPTVKQATHSVSQRSRSIGNRKLLIGLKVSYYQSFMISFCPKLPGDSYNRFYLQTTLQYSGFKYGNTNV